MKETDSALYEAFKAKDIRFDGRFFVGISSTKIYCRPVCRAKQPKKENCTFFSTAAAAEQAGYRPCLLCRPELAPGASVTDASSVLARKAAKLLEENCGTGQSLETLAGKLGCTARHLRRVFAEEYHVTPVQYLQTCRLLLAKSLLTDTKLSVLDAAMAAGFGSLRRFNDLFQKRYHLSPTALRKSAADGAIQTSEITVQLGYHPPYRWEEMLKFLSLRAISGVEKTENGTYMRTVRLADKSGAWRGGWISVKDHPKKHTLSVTLSDTLAPVLTQVLTRVKRLFDLYCEPEVVYETLQTMDKVKPGICVPGLRLPGCFDAFETAVRAILGQQITVRAASMLAGRIAEACGTPVETGIEGLTHTFPRPEDILFLENTVEEALGTLGVTAARSRCIAALAKALNNGEIELDGCMDPETEMKKLMQIKGIGSWTANYIAMRTMEWPDAFLETDSGVKHALPGYSPRELLAISEQWKPWRSYATMNLWNSLS
ncbi:MAG: AlkA N-terminal domain-containing protein [Eubacteriales bacterium]|nr:AlkA N-terminal domain-containing protein [Eubacteriales bacterium]